jgi:para-aminobenzoate synthetase component 1
MALLESPVTVTGDKACSLAQYSICAGPPRRIGDRLQVWTPTVGNILPTLRGFLEAGAGNDWVAPDSPDCPDPALPFWGGWLGWLGYDLAWEIEDLPQINSDPLPFPVAFWYEPACFAILDHQAQRLWLAAPTRPELAHLQQILATAAVEDANQNLVSGHTDQFLLNCDQCTFEAAVNTAKQYIKAGDVFQVNLSLRFQAETTAEPWQVYRRLQQINPSPFASYWQTPWGSVISCSPERLVKLQHGIAETRPIAGTRPRGQTSGEDQQLATALRANRKENAEHIMLVDLERNDLGRVCAWGSVVVDELMVIERYSHVMHLVSNVMGQLQPEATAIDLIAAMFPGGTITGCPKVRCMEIIETLEPLRRNLFYGSCGYLDYRGHLDLNILIRTLLMAVPDPHQPFRQTVWGQVGAGIVADSDPHREWSESLQKAKAQLLALSL